MFSAKVRKKSMGMIKHMCVLRFFLVAVMVIILAAATPKVWAFGNNFWADGSKFWADDNGEEEPFEEAYIYFELNNTDGDLGIHALIDGEPWKRLEIEDPNERRMLGVSVRGSLRKQGLTEFFFESAEPTFDELPTEQFFRRSPEGVYEIEGILLDGEELESEVELTHVMPAPPVVYLMIGKKEEVVPAAENCDAEELPEVEAGEQVSISWEEVTDHHSELGGEGDIVVQNYEVVVEIDETLWKTSIILSPDARSFQVPPEILELAEFEDGEAEVKFEVLVRAESYNQTAVESCFVIAE